MALSKRLVTIRRLRYRRFNVRMRSIGLVMAVRNHHFLGDDFRTEQVFNVPLLCANKNSKMESVVIVNVPDQKV